MKTFSKKLVVFNGSRPSVTYDELWNIFDDLLQSQSTKGIENDSRLVCGNIYDAKRILTNGDFIVVMSFVCRFHDFSVGANVLLCQCGETTHINFLQTGSIDCGVVSSGMCKEKDWQHKLMVELIGIDALLATQGYDIEQFLSLFGDNEPKRSKAGNSAFFCLVDDINKKMMPPDNEFECWLNQRLKSISQESHFSLQFLEGAQEKHPQELIRNVLESLNTSL